MALFVTTMGSIMCVAVTVMADSSVVMEPQYWVANVVLAAAIFCLYVHFKV